MTYADQKLSDLAISIPMASALFRKNRLDFCCGGGQTLRQACTNQQLDLDSIDQQLQQLQPKKVDGLETWPLNKLTEFIVDRYHQDLRRRIPELIALAQKVERVHADNPECPAGLQRLLGTMLEELESHMMKEEKVLFPMIEQGLGSKAQMPITVMSAEHEAHGQQLQKLHEISGDFTPPEGACGSWRTLYSGLEKLEEELMEHIHLENNILFPRALSQ